MHIRAHLTGILPLLAVLLVAGCELAAPVTSRPPAGQQNIPKVSERSDAVRRHYEKVQADLLDQGLMRTDGGGMDTPFNARQLANNFIRIALYNEYVSDGGQLVASESRSRLRRWEGPVNVSLRFGDSVPADRRATDHAKVASYVARLAQITGHPIRMSDVRANYFVYIVNEDERRAMGSTLAQIDPSLGQNDVSAITNLDLSTFCLVYALSPDGSANYTRAVAVIRAEHPDLLRLSCIHEELAQGLGLANDSPRARPSIFNDDEEFSLLTVQDELMLRMLYDPRLHPGMTESEARPIVEIIASELLGGES